MTAVKTPLSARTIWGKAILYLKEHKEIALHVACGDITDVALEGNKFIINLFDGMLINLLEEGKRKIEQALRWQGLELQVVVKIKKEILSDSEQDLKRLNEVFDNVKITHTNLLWR